MILNKIKGGSLDQENLRNCTDLANTISRKHIAVVECIIADCSEFEEAQSVLDKVLDYLSNNIIRIDEQLLSTHQSELNQLQEKIRFKLDKAKKIIGTPPSEFTLFEKSFNGFWKRLKPSLESFLREFERYEGYTSFLKERFKYKIEELHKNFPIPLNSSVAEWTQDSGVMHASYRKFLEQVRIRLSREFNTLDSILEELVEMMKDRLARILVEQVELSGLSNSRGSGFFEDLISLVPSNESENLRLGFQILSDFKISYSSFLQPQIRVIINKSISTLEETRISVLNEFTDPIAISSKVFTTPEEVTEEIKEILSSSLLEIIQNCEVTLHDSIHELNNLFYVTVEEFVDHVLYTEEAQSEWRIFLYANRHQVWDTFNGIRDFVTIGQEWQQLITDAETVNANPLRLL